MLDEKIRVKVDNMSGLLYGIDYDKQMAIVEMDYSFLVEFTFRDVIV